MIETPRLVLRLPRPGDAESLLEFVGDEEVMRPIGDEAGGLEKAEAFVERWIKRWERNGVGQFIVEHDGHVFGRVGLIVWDGRTWETSAYDLAGEHAQEELGWALVRRAWGYGYATEAAQAVKSWCREERGIKRLVSLIAPDNVRSQRVAEKLGACRGERIETAVGPTDVWGYLRCGGLTLRDKTGRQPAGDGSIQTDPPRPTVPRAGGASPGSRVSGGYVGASLSLE